MSKSGRRGADEHAGGAVLSVSRFTFCGQILGEISYVRRRAANKREGSRNGERWIFIWAEVPYPRKLVRSRYTPRVNRFAILLDLAGHYYFDYAL